MNNNFTLTDKQKYRCKVLPKMQGNEETICYLMGFWLGDGSRTLKERFEICLSNHNEENKDLENQFKKVFPKYHFSDIGVSKSIIANCTAFMNWLLENTESGKLWEIIKPYKWSFIAGLINSDGWVQCPHKDEDERIIHICFGNNNLSLVQKLQEFLKEEGIDAKIRIHDKVGKKITINGRVVIIKNIQYWLVVNRRADNFIFANHLLPFVSRSDVKQRLLNYIEFYEERHLQQKLPIIEIFKSVQGEGLDIGKIQTFVRLAGCNLKCRGCDSAWSWKVSKKYKITIEEILKMVESLGWNEVCLTGGEVMLYPERIKALCAFLKSKGYYINLQTNGTLYDATVFSLVDCVDMDIKSPCTGEKSNVKLIKNLREKDYIKVLIEDEIDLQYARSLDDLAKDVGCSIILQPYNKVTKNTTMDLLKKLKWISEEVLNDIKTKKHKWGKVRVLPQQHVLIWGNRRGV